MTPKNQKYANLRRMFLTYHDDDYHLSTCEIGRRLGISAQAVDQTLLRGMFKAGVALIAKYGDPINELLDEGV